MNRTDKRALLILILAMLLLPPTLGALHERPGRGEEPVRVVVEHATPTRWYRTPTPRPPEPSATVFVMRDMGPTCIPATPWPYREYVYRETTVMTEQEAIEWLRSVGQ